MFREHVVWLREAHIKDCGFRKPPVEKQDASSVRSGADCEMLLFRRQTSPGSPACLSLEANREIRDIIGSHRNLELILSERAGCAADFNSELQNTAGYKDAGTQRVWTINAALSLSLVSDYNLLLVQKVDSKFFAWSKCVNGRYVTEIFLRNPFGLPFPNWDVLSCPGGKLWTRGMDNAVFSHTEEISGQRNSNVAATCVSLFTYACLLTAGISWFKPQHNSLNY